MRKPLLSLLLLALAAPVYATWWPAWSASEIWMKVGETTTLQVHPWWSGITDMGNGINWIFGSSDERVFTANVSVSRAMTYDVPVVAVGPGVATISRKSPDDGHFLPIAPSVTVHVTCGQEPPLRVASPALRVAIHETVPLIAISEIADRTHFAWYLGRIGDTAHPLEGSGPSIDFTPAAYGVHYVWVSATTACSTSAAEFAVEVPRLRRRVAPR